MKEFIKLVLLLLLLFVMVVVVGALMAWSWNGFFPHVFGLPFIKYGHALSLLVFLSSIRAFFKSYNYSK